jgi:hypothetical protein
MTIKETKRRPEPAAVQAQAEGKDGRRFVRDARRGAVSRESGQFWYGIWRSFGRA